MSKFFIFFICSFILHLALGGVLLYRSGLIGKSSEVEVDTTSMEEGEGLQSLDGKDSVKESELLMEEPPPPPVKEPVKKKKKKAVKKVSKPKPKPKPKKIEPAPPPVEEPPPSPPAPVEEAPKEVAPEPVKEAPTLPPVPAPVEEAPAPSVPEPVEEAPEPEPVEEAPASVEEPSAPSGDSNSLESGNPLIENQPVQAGATPETARVFDQLKQLPGNPLPEYPKEALEQKWEGAVEVLYYVSTGGFVEQIQVSHSSGHITLDNAAIKTLSRYRYELGQEGWVRHRVEFFLEKDKEIKEIVPLRTMDDQ